MEAYESQNVAHDVSTDVLDSCKIRVVKAEDKQASDDGMEKHLRQLVIVTLALLIISDVSPWPWPWSLRPKSKSLALALALKVVLGLGLGLA